MKVTKFKLVDDGYNGVIVEGIEYIKKGNITIPDSVKRQRRVAIDDFTKESIQKLKYFYLNLTGHWIPPYSKYYDMGAHELAPLEDKGGAIPQGQSLLRQLWNETKITGVSLSETGFVIMGTIETVAEKIIGISTPHITEDDDIGFYLEAREYIDSAIDNILGYFKKNVLMPFDDPKKYLEKYVKENLDDKSAQEMTEMVIERLSQKGAIIMMNADSDDEVDTPAIGEISGKDEVSVHVTGNIDKENMGEQQDIGDEKVEEVKVEEKEEEEETRALTESEMLIEMIKETGTLKELKMVVKEYEEFKSIRGLLSKFSTLKSLRDVMLAEIVSKTGSSVMDDDDSWHADEDTSFVADEAPIAEMEYSQGGNFPDIDE